MSTILNALRKVEEERRASGHSSRERLLFFPQVTPPPSRKGVWVIGLVLMGVGFASGMGVALLRSGPTVSTPAAQPAPVALAPMEQPSARPVSSIAAASRLPEEQRSRGAEEQRSQGAGEPGSGRVEEITPAPLHLGTLAQKAPLHTQEGLQYLSVGDPPFLSVVQRSPFAAPKEQYGSERQLHRQATLKPQASGLSSSLDMPKVSLNLLQWSPEAERRLAFISVNSGPLLMVHEGDTLSGLTVERILPDTVELRFGDSTFVVKPVPSSSSSAPSAP